MPARRELLAPSSGAAAAGAFVLLDSRGPV